MASRHAEREKCERLIDWVQKEIADKTWKLVSGDIVYVGQTRWPYKVMRTGYGDYEKEVRIARISEDTRRWETGRWVRTDQCYKLEIGDTLDVIEQVVAATDDASIISEGARCRFAGWDPDGDAILTIGVRRLIVFFEDLDKLTLE